MMNRTDKTLTLDLTTEAGRQAARLYAGWLIIMTPAGTNPDAEEYARELFEWIDELDQQEPAPGGAVAE